MRTCRSRRRGVSLTELLVTTLILGLACTLLLRITLAVLRPSGPSPGLRLRALRCLETLRRDLGNARFVLHPRSVSGPRRGRSIIWIDWRGRLRALVTTGSGLVRLDESDGGTMIRTPLPLPPSARFLAQHRGRDHRAYRLRLHLGGHMIMTSAVVVEDLAPIPLPLLCWSGDTP